RSGSVGLMGYYFMLSIAAVFPALWMLWRTQVAAGYQNVYNLLKLLIAIGVFSIVLMHWTA
ncbi:MAG: ubiquinone biosynthesis protein UbiA, partial [Flavobacteriaceae bacterium]